ncbi:hypothetical protein [Halobellus sp. GM3]
MITPTVEPVAGGVSDVRVSIRDAVGGALVARDRANEAESSQEIEHV